ncbi:MAG: hypothetical protein K8R92_05715 [Planctomycetes bacterium]|nr:hypothetical protein [Planctomycetota bacterium]
MPECIRPQADSRTFPRFFQRWMAASIACAAALLTACTTPPGISVTGVDVVEVGTNSNEVAIRLQMSNPTKVPIRIDTWSYSIRVRNESVYSGEWVAAVTIPPESRLITAIPAVVPVKSRPGPDSPWSVSGSVQYLETSRFSQLLYDLGLNRPSTSFSSSGSGMGSGGSIPSAG